MHVSFVEIGLPPTGPATADARCPRASDQILFRADSRLDLNGPRALARSPSTTNLLTSSSERARAGIVIAWR